MYSHRISAMELRQLGEEAARQLSEEAARQLGEEAARLVAEALAEHSDDDIGSWKTELRSSLSDPKQGEVFEGHRWLTIFLQQARDEDPEFTNEIFRLLLEHDFPRFPTSEEKREYFQIGIGGEVAALENNQRDFPIFNRFLSCMPQTFRKLCINFRSGACPREIFNWLPDEIVGSSLEFILDRPFDEDFHEEELPDRKGTIEHFLYCCRSVEKLRLEGFKASTLDPCEIALPVFESISRSLSLSKCEFKNSSGQLLHETTKFPRLTSLSFATEETHFWAYAFRSFRANELGMKDMDLFWSTWFVAAKSLRDLEFKDAAHRHDLVAPDDPGYALFAAMCRAAADPLHYAQNLTQLEIIGHILGPVQLDNLRMISRSPVSKSLKRLTLFGCRVDERFGSILTSLSSLESLDFSASTESHSQYNSVLLKYFSKNPSSLKSLTIARDTWISTEVINCMLSSTLETLMLVNTFLFSSSVPPQFSTAENGKRIEAFIDLLPTSSIRHVHIAEFDLNLAAVSQMIDRADQLRSVRFVEQIGLGPHPTGGSLMETESLVEKVATKPNLFSFWLQRDRDFHELQQRVSLYCFIHRVRHSLISSSINKRGFLPHLLKITNDEMGPNGIYMLLKENLLEDVATKGIGGDPSNSTSSDRDFGDVTKSPEAKRARQR